MLKQVPCYLLLSLYPFFYPCLYPNQSGYRGYTTPWFCKEWRVPLNRGIYTAFSYIIFISLIICYVTEPTYPIVYIVEALLVSELLLLLSIYNKYNISIWKEELLLNYFPSTNISIYLNSKYVVYLYIF